MTLYGGASGAGVIFKWDGTTYTDVHDFDNTNGSNPQGSLIQGTDGNFYGMTSGGGANNYGVIFKWDGTTYTDIHDFDGTNGSNPLGSLIQGSNGNFYGMTSGGGASGVGVIFKWDGTTYTDIHDFDYTHGIYPYGSLIQGTDGNFYGMTLYGGASGAGVIFKWKLNPTPLFAPSAILDGAGLEDNGGPVKTIALLSGSLAINAGDNSKAPSTDARGMSRVGTSDIGAYEYQGTQENSNTTPTPTTSSASSLTTTSATLNGNITNTGGVNPTIRGFNYGTTDSYGSSISTTGSYGISSYSADISSLTCGTLYHFQSYATNTTGIGYGDDQTFTTSACHVTSTPTPTSSQSSGGGFIPGYGPKVTTPTVVVPPVTPTTPTVTPTTPSTPHIFTKTLKLNNKGDEVKYLQIYLNTHGYTVAKKGVGSLGKESNLFGPATKKALMKFQKDHNLKPDGILGPKSRELMV